MSRVTHEQIAAALGAFVPTPEQQRIIEAPLEPALVVAGAGSGKTQTMMTRILWLIANEDVAPHEILGLTFTRKAAGELRERVESGIAALRTAGLVELDEFDLPVVSTYNAFANDVYSQYALLIGCEPDALVLDEPGAFSLMRELVIDSDDADLLASDSKVGTAVKNALTIARAMRENGITGERLQDFLDEFEGAFARLPEESGTKTIRDQVANVSKLRPYAELATAYQARKRELGRIEFADQVADAAEILRRDPGVARELRALHRVVILDEYQDTSVGQTELLSGLFRGHAVMAVGDPKQSIYGWRGASAANMSRFALDFGARGEPYELSISWRNDRAILDAANHVARPLPEARATPGSAAGTAPTELRARPKAGEGRVETAFVLSDTVEAQRIAEWMHERLAADPAGGDRTAAILVRARSQIAAISAALAARGVPYRIQGLGGLLADPAIVDLNCIVRASINEHAGNELIRLLLGSGTELGLADLAALAELRRWLGERDESLQKLEPALRSELRTAPQAAEEGASLAEALEYVRRNDDARLLERGLSAVGITRMRSLAQTLHELRALATLPLVDFIDAAIRRARLDVETIANPRNPIRAANLDAYRDAVRAYTAASPDAGIEEFLDWLDLAETDDTLEVVVEAAEIKGAVELTTMHSAKGLEWDYVAVPQQCGTATTPQPEVKGVKGWFGSHVLPYDLRRDASDLPKIDWRNVESWKDFKRDFEGRPDEDGLVFSFTGQQRQRLLDEHRRLIYVALTRAKRELLVTTSLWKNRNATPQWPSDHFHEVAPGVEPWLEALDPGVRHELADGTTLRITEDFDHAAEKKRIAEFGNPAGPPTRISWPRPPMPTDALERQHALRDALEALAGGDADRSSDYDVLIDLLIDEQARNRESARLALPNRFGASYFHEVIEQPERIARNAARPMPQEPHTATLLGNLFHGWVESLFTNVSAGATYLDGLDADEDDDTGLATMTERDRERLEQFKSTFLASRFAPAVRRPAAVELPIELPIAGIRVVGKIDAVYVDEVQVGDAQVGAAQGDGADVDEALLDDAQQGNAQDGKTAGRVEIVDWKTGVPPRTAAERASRELQLHCYAHAYAAATGTPIERLTATLYYVAADQELSIDRIRPLDELEALLAGAEAALVQ